MKTYVFIILQFIIGNCISAQHFGFSSGLYRLPYANSVNMTVGSDVYTHSPRGKYDLVTSASNPTIVAAADGWVRWIQEDFDTSCVTIQGGQIISCCWQFNNFVVIEHPNGEWSQYTHMDEGSTSNAGISMNEWVTAGTPLGTEGTVGCSTGDHLHFEVSRPFDPDVPFDTIGGFLNEQSGTSIAEMLIPVIGGIGTSMPWMQTGNVHAAGPSDDNCPTTIEVMGNQNNGNQYVARADEYILTDNANPVTYAGGSTSLFRAGDYVRMRPGFHVQAGSKFKVVIRGCNTQN